MDIAMIDDQFLPADELRKPYLDRGLFFGDGVYEVLRSYEGNLFALDEHMARFERSLKEIQIFGIDIKQVQQKVITAYEKCGYANARVYFHITRGSEARREHVPNPNTEPNFFLTIDELHTKPGLKEKGIAVSTQPDWRWKRCDIKSLNLLPNVMAKIEAHKRGAGEAILVGDDGTITEGAGSAFFAVEGKTIITRPLGHEILPSITRAMVMQVAKDAGIEAVEKTLTPKQAAACSELFMAVTTKDVVPITKFDDVVISGGTCGAITNRLIKQFKEFVRHSTR
ncbi:MAG: aminotransferase class IV [Planctomycetaceae bacterium]|nr:aminotransferase class IV [Planctomycetaceae bacterium]